MDSYFATAARSNTAGGSFTVSTMDVVKPTLLTAVRVFGNQNYPFNSYNTSYTATGVLSLHSSPLLLSGGFRPLYKDRVDAATPSNVVKVSTANANYSSYSDNIFGQYSPYGNIRYIYDFTKTPIKLEPGWQVAVNFYFPSFFSETYECTWEWME